MAEQKKLWTEKEVQEELKKFDEKIAGVDDMNTDLISVESIMFDKAKFLKDKAR